MQCPKTRYEDFQAYEEGKLLLRRGLAEGRISRAEHDRDMLSIEEKWSDRVFPEDEHLFDNIDGLVGFLMDNGLTVIGIGHEMMHAREAKLRGYTVKYGCRLVLVDEFFVGYVPFVKVIEDPRRDDFVAIALAPEEPSLADREAIEYLS